MAQVIYFIDNIYEPINGEKSYVTFLPAEFQSEQPPMIVEFYRNQMGLNGHPGKMKEGWYVIYDNKAEGNPFTYGNRNSVARKNYKDFKNILQLLLQNNRWEESRNSVALLEQLSIDENVLVTSYHVNVGHGNCSAILILYGGEYQIWMIDGSLSEKGNGHQYAVNLEVCFDEISQRLGITKDAIKINRFFLTHPHIDHFSGVEYLINSGYIDSNTICYWNLYYHWTYAKYVNTLNLLQQNNVKFIEPVSGHSTKAFSFMHPESRIFRSRGTIGPHNCKYRIVGSPVNNCSAVIRFQIGGKTMVFPGDLERGGFDKMTISKSCSPKLIGVDYYAISHHGSLNGHPDIPCLNPNPNHPSKPLDCISKRNCKSILMGRDGAYPGIYSPVVTSFWSGRNTLVKTEDATHFVELEWGSGNVVMR